MTFIRHRFTVLAALLFAHSAAATVDQSSPALVAIRSAIAAKGTAQIIVDFAATTPAAQVRAELTNANIPIVQSFQNLPQLVVTVDGTQLNTIAALPDITAVHLNTPHRARELPPELRQFGAIEAGLATATPQGAASDPAGTTDTARDIRADLVWAQGVTGAGQTIAILDNGIDDQHVMFSGKITTEACFSPVLSSGDQSLCPGGAAQVIGAGAAAVCPQGNNACQHGTHVTGILGGASPVARGVAYGANLLPIQVFTLSSDPTQCTDTPTCLISYDSAQISALDYVIGLAANTPIAAVNMSLGGDPIEAVCDTNPLKPAVDALRNLGVLTSMAAGNEAQLGIIDPPACISSAVAVSSVLVTAPDPTTNQAPTVALLAPGYNVLSALPGNNYGLMSGSSMATAQVSGAIALLKSKSPQAHAADIEAALKAGGIATRSTGWTWTTPRMDVNAALERLEGIAPAPTGVPVIGVHPSTDMVAQSYLRLHNAETSSAPVNVTILDGTGATLGIWSATIPPHSSPQFGMAEIESEAIPAINPASVTSYVLYVDSPYAGHVQHVLWNPAAGALTDMSGCMSGLSSDTHTLINVHTTQIPAYPSYVLVHNTGTVAATPHFDVQDARNGQDFGTFAASVAIPPLGTAVIPVSSAMQFLGYAPSATQYHLNLVLDPTFTGYAQHLIDDQTAQIITNMTPKCDL